jgi:hypothetical protein
MERFSELNGAKILKKIRIHQTTFNQIKYFLYEQENHKML